MKLFTKHLYDTENMSGQTERHYRVYKLGFKGKSQLAWLSIYYEEFCVIKEFGYAGIIWSI